MKKYILVNTFCIAAALMILSSWTALATTPPCEFPCDDGLDWEDHISVQFLDDNCPGMPGCIFTISYLSKEIVCNGIHYKNTYIYEVSYSDACTTCYSTETQILARAERVLQEAQLTGLNPNDSNVVVNTSKMACWTHVATSAYTLVPCGESPGCCFNSYSYVWDQANQEWYISEAYTNHVIDECIEPCVYTCTPNWVEKLPSPQSYYYTDLEVAPNPADDRVSISFYSDYEGSITLSIYDISGNVVKIDNFIKSNRQFEKNVDVSSFAAGTYLITASSESGIIFNTQKIFVE